MSGWKQSRQDPLNKTLPSRFFNWTVRKTTGHPAARLQLRPQGLPPRCRRHISVYGELHRYIPVVAAKQGFRVAEIKVSIGGAPPGNPSTAGSDICAATSTCSPCSSWVATSTGRSTCSAGSGTLMIVVGVLVELSDHRQDRLRPRHRAAAPVAAGHAAIIVGIQLSRWGSSSELIANCRAREGGETHAGGADCRRRRRAGCAGGASAARGARRPRRGAGDGPPPRPAPAPESRAVAGDHEPLARLLRHVRARPTPATP